MSGRKLSDMPVQRGNIHCNDYHLHPVKLHSILIINQDPIHYELQATSSNNLARSSKYNNSLV